MNIFYLLAALLTERLLSCTDPSAVFPKEERPGAEDSDQADVDSYAETIFYVDAHNYGEGGLISDDNQENEERNNPEMSNERINDFYFSDGSPETYEVEYSERSSELEILIEELWESTDANGFDIQDANEEETIRNQPPELAQYRFFASFQGAGFEMRYRTSDPEDDPVETLLINDTLPASSVRMTSDRITSSPLLESGRAELLLALYDGTNRTPVRLSVLISRYEHQVSFETSSGNYGMTLPDVHYRHLTRGVFSLEAGHRELTCADPELMGRMLQNWRYFFTLYDVADVQRYNPLSIWDDVIELTGVAGRGGCAADDTLRFVFYSIDHMR